MAKRALVMDRKGDNSCLISGDWGTSTLRLRLVETEPFRLLEEVRVQQGIAATHNDWQRSGKARQPFYLAHLREALSQLTGGRDGIPVILSGMASSTVGIEEVPYAPLPFPLQARGLVCRVLGPTKAFPHELTLIGGLRWEDRDVMRGEECQALGLHRALSEGVSNAPVPASYRLILPGTHSKHLMIDDGVITGSKTFLTGELFAVLATHSILQHSVSGERQVLHREAFRAGVVEARDRGCLASLFGVRCRDLLQGAAAEDNNAFLSGLLVGGELAFLRDGGGAVVLAADDDLGALYLDALEVLGFEGDVHRVSKGVMAEAVPRAHLLVHLEM